MNALWNIMKTATMGRGPRHNAVCVAAELRQLLNEQELAGVAGTLRSR